LSDKPSTQLAFKPALGSMNKGLGFIESELDANDVGGLDWNLLREDLSLPSAVLYQDRLLHNLRWMHDFVTTYGVRLAPHGKTTMTPRLFAMQLQAGAWGITVATPHQTLVAYNHGVRRVLMANQLVGKQNIAIIERLLRDRGFEYYCLVDSAELIDQLGTYFSLLGQRLHVLLEFGVMGGRSGIRNEKQLHAALAALSRWSDAISLDGVELYEGVLDDESAVRTFLQHVSDVTRNLMAGQQFQRSPILLSGAGSAWYDVVAEVFSAAGFGDSVEIVLRPGCYLTHDVGAYRRAQERILERNPIAHRMNAGLVPAMQVWAYVQSVPEPEKAIIGMGKRDAAFDSGLPVPALHFRPGNPAPTAAFPSWTVTKMMDQHAYMRITSGDDLRVGDMVGFDICHPCLTFDKWRAIPVLDENYQVIDIVQTFF
jgi:D-serine dehydratase